MATGCASNTNSTEHNGGLIHERNQGYSLLYALMTDESKVDGLLVIKSVNDPLAKLVRQIAAASKQARQQLDSYVGSDSRIVIDEPDLPKLEDESRDLESKRDTKNLLLTSGKELQLNLIFTQAQATGYAANLSQALANREDDAGRKQFLTDLAKQFAGYRDQLMGMLAVKG
jgi:predicted component of type VI protein secretion system